MNLDKIQKNTPKAILKFAIPSIIAMILTSAISIIDGYYIGNYIGKSAITAINLGLPILYIYLAVGIMIGVGGVSQATRLLGAKKVGKSIIVFNQTVVTSITLLIMLSLLFIPSLNIISKLFSVDSTVKTYFVDYYFVMILVYPAMMFNVVLGMFVRAEGRPVVFMILSIISVIMNTVLDHLFMNYTNLGVTGIAIASVISILTGLMYMLAYFWFKSKTFKLAKFVFVKSILVDTFQNGSSAFISQISLCITTIVLNFIILKEGGVNGVAAFSVVGYATYLFSMIVTGFGQGASPLISFSNGAKQHFLSIKIRKITSLYVTVLGLFALIALLFGANEFSRLFIENSTVNSMVSSGVPIFSLVFLFMGMNIITSFYFTSIGQAKTSAIISAARGLVILLICILVFPALWGMHGVWFIAPTTEFLTLFISLFFIFLHDKKQTHSAIK